MIRSKFLPYPFLFILVGAFILACGTNHVLVIVTLWHPYCRLEGLAKVGTALVLLPGQLEQIILNLAVNARDARCWIRPRILLLGKFDFSRIPGVDW